MARPNSVNSKKSSARLQAATRAFQKFRHEEEKPEPVLDPHGKTKQQQQLKLNFDTHCKIIISRKAAKILKSLSCGINSATEKEEEEYDNSLQTWDDYIYQIAGLVKELQKKLLQKQQQEQTLLNSDNDSDSDTDNKDEIEMMMPIYSDTDIPLKVSQRTLELWKKLYKEVSAREKEYVISYSALLCELIEYYAKSKGLEKQLGLSQNSTTLQPKVGQSHSHHAPKIKSLDQLAD